eukprot:CAMPEP_0172483570 /NCGR_PEP_ID=MMETSP1066-20121228/10554_1 /TAXON_ID=671091 /ORGANISM="Coscinodiscus wailesii, Strain CCMP2513" /LENGTH=68 /DNA_ID=CAMNT_0013247489 /DNA_START=21 /DNA_END=227 /DNA_ORIENTATION=-
MNPAFSSRCHYDVSPSPAFRNVGLFKITESRCRTLNGGGDAPAAAAPLPTPPPEEDAVDDPLDAMTVV